jgi:hypothetical protein
MWTRFYTIVPIPFGALNGQNAFILCLGNFYSSKNFNHIAKVASILHFKSGDNYKPSHFLTSTPSKHTFHHHGWLITSNRFLTLKKYNQPYAGYWFLTERNFYTLSKLIWHPVNSHFSFFLSLCTFSQSTICLLIKLCRVASSNCTPY